MVFPLRPNKRFVKGEAEEQPFFLTFSPRKPDIMVLNTINNGKRFYG